MGILECLGLRKKEEARPQDTIARYELYKRQPGGKWNKIRDLKEKVDLEDISYLKPGFTYQLCSRAKRGYIRTIWQRHVPGPSHERIVEPIADMRRALEQITEFAEGLKGILPELSGALAWAFPQSQGGGNMITAPTYKGELPAYLHPVAPKLAMAWGPVLGNLVKAVITGLREGLTGVESKEEFKPEAGWRFTRPPPNADDYLRKDVKVRLTRPKPTPLDYLREQEKEAEKAEDAYKVVVEEEPTGPLRVCRECGLEALTREALELFVKHPRSKHGRMKLCKECHRSMFRKGGKYASEKSTEPEAEVAELASDPDDDGVPRPHMV